MWILKTACWVPKVGDRVKIKKPAVVNGQIGWCPGMDALVGVEQEVVQVLPRGVISAGELFIVASRWTLEADWVEFVWDPTIFTTAAVASGSWVPKPAGWVPKRGDLVRVKKPAMLPNGRSPAGVFWAAPMDAEVGKSLKVVTVFSTLGFTTDGAGWAYDSEWVESVWLPAEAVIPAMIERVRSLTASIRDFDGFCTPAEHPEFAGWCGGFRFHRLTCPRRFKA